MSTPRGATELIPGDLTGLATVARALADLAELCPTETGLRCALAAAGAHDRLARALVDLRQRAEEVYVTSASLGVGDDLLANREAVLARRSERPDLMAQIDETLRRAIDVRLAWVDAHQNFLDAVLPLVEALDSDRPAGSHRRT